MSNQKFESLKEKCLLAKIKASVYGQGQCSEELFDLILGQNLSRSIEISEEIVKTNLIIINGSLNEYEKQRLKKDLSYMGQHLYLLKLGRHQQFEKTDYGLDNKRFKKVVTTQSFIPSRIEIEESLEKLWKA